MAKITSGEHPIEVVRFAKGQNEATVVPLDREHMAELRDRLTMRLAQLEAE